VQRRVARSVDRQRIRAGVQQLRHGVQSAGARGDVQRGVAAAGRGGVGRRAAPQQRAQLFHRQLRRGGPQRRAGARQRRLGQQERQQALARVFRRRQRGTQDSLSHIRLCEQRREQRRVVLFQPHALAAPVRRRFGRESKLRYEAACSGRAVLLRSQGGDVLSPRMAHAAQHSCNAPPVRLLRHQRERQRRRARYVA
jgi:hypothetical protein